MRKLLIFDADGTLFDSHYTLYKVWDIIAIEFKKDLFTDYDHFKSIFKKYNGDWKGYAVNEFKFNDEDLIKVDHTFSEIMESLYKEFTKWYENMVFILNELTKRGHTLAIATNNYKFIFDSFFEKEGLSYPTYDHISHKGFKKPEPNMILDHANNLGFSLENTVMIGDSLMDLEAARNAKVLSVWAKYGSLENPIILTGLHDYILETPDDLLELFN